MRIAVARSLKQGGLRAEEAREVLAAWEVRIVGHIARARGRWLGYVGSPRAAMREWRWLAMLRGWRLRASGGAPYAFEPATQLLVDVLSWVKTWQLSSCAISSRISLPPADVWVGFAGASAHSRDGLAARSLTPRAKHRWCGGRRRYEQLKGAAVQSGSEPDRFGFWAVHDIVKVRRPAVRRGRQLEALVQFVGVDPVEKTPHPMKCT